LKHKFTQALFTYGFHFPLQSFRYELQNTTDTFFSFLVEISVRSTQGCAIALHQMPVVCLFLSNFLPVPRFSIHIPAVTASKESQTLLK